MKQKHYELFETLIFRYNQKNRLRSDLRLIYPYKDMHSTPGPWSELIVDYNCYKLDITR